MTRISSEFSSLLAEHDSWRHQTRHSAGFLEGLEGQQMASVWLLLSLLALFIILVILDTHFPVCVCLMRLPVGIYEYVALLVPSPELAAVSELKPLTRLPVQA